MSYLGREEVRSFFQDLVADCGGPHLFARTHDVRPQHVQSALAGKRTFPKRILRSYGLRPLIAYELKTYERNGSAK